ncbi:RhoGAP-domain-containing protein [Tilletiaria anomala UBC 951]|uniref:RhoGAP-domain-containing protein n=1 Tax=Tilletiaria anomala (strain ATCC 24038 / CBS 436.72 / UBC 951) TaxID=1037660 RepID=A0A066WBR4_TILAU|nr:RhoGAP-domain-containing protein [Tilletiaria anomala UBC 951]KDN48220.1 RhoGAP-domain-containing protein [Tilletiaria anomala UBC 951]
MDLPSGAGAGGAAHTQGPQQHAVNSSTTLIIPPARKSSEAGPYGGSSAAPADLSSAIIDAFKATLREAEAYTSFYESRLKVEEDYLKAFRSMVDKQRELDSKIDGKGMRNAVVAKPRATLRGAWHELRENDLRELETRSHMADTIRQGVLTPLIAFRDAQERIRKRVKEDLKTHLSNYDEMRNVTLPRIKKQYDKKCEEVETLRLQQMAAEDQRALLSAGTTGGGGMPGLLDVGGGGSSSGGSYHSSESSDFPSGPPPRPDFHTSNSLPIHQRLSSDPARMCESTAAAAETSSRPSLHVLPAAAMGKDLQASQPPTPAPGSVNGAVISSHAFSPPSHSRSGHQQQQQPPPPSKAEGQREKDKDEKKPNFFDALRHKEGWENARKEAPRKINAFISRMRDERGGVLGIGGGDKVDRDVAYGSGVGGGAGGGGSSNSSGGGSVVGGLLAGVGVGVSSSHEYAAAGAGGGGSGSGGSGGGGGGGLFGGAREPSMKAGAHSIALKTVKAKRESEELDRVYRKAIFDLETLRIRREKTIAAAIESCKECKRELSLTAQASWLQAERAGLLLSSSNVSLKTHAEEVVLKCTDALETEIRDFEETIPHIEQIIEDKVTYVNYWHGVCQDLLFGTSLTDYAFSHNRGAGSAPQPPLVVTKCIQFLEGHAMKHPGIYRISAKHSALQNLAHAIERNEADFQFDPARDEPAAVAGLLKLYLRQLPEPVLPIPWEERIKYTHERDEHVQAGFPMLKSRIRRAPSINQVTLKAIVEHLARVAAHADENKMTASNLAVVFGPVLLSEADHGATSLAAAMEEDKTMEDLISYHQIIFGALAVSSPPLAQPQPSLELVFGPTAIVAPDSPVCARGTTTLKRSSAILKGNDHMAQADAGTSNSAKSAPLGYPSAGAAAAGSHTRVKSSADEYAAQTSQTAMLASGSGASPAAATTASNDLLIFPSGCNSALPSLGHSQEGSADCRAAGSLHLAASSAQAGRRAETLSSNAGAHVDNDAVPASATTAMASNGHATTAPPTPALKSLAVTSVSHPS